MIPPHWQRYERTDDGEVLGYLVPDGSDGDVVPVTVFGYPLGPALPRDAAARVLEEEGLSSLAGRWLLDVPDRDEPVDVEIVEASPEKLTMKIVDFGCGNDWGTIIALEVPISRGLRPG